MHQAVPFSGGTGSTAPVTKNTVNLSSASSASLTYQNLGGSNFLYTAKNFQSLDIPTRISEYATDYSKTAEKVSSALENRGWTALGEHKNVTPDAVKAIVEASY